VERPGTDTDHGITALRATERPDDIALLLATRRPGLGSPG
jgi:tRNA (Thr-GGU) A37 N-methylase